LSGDASNDQNSHDEKVRRIYNELIYMQGINYMLELTIDIFPLEKLTADQVFKALKRIIRFELSTIYRLYVDYM